MSSDSKSKELLTLNVFGSKLFEKSFRVMYLQVTSKQFLIRLNAIYEEKGSCFFLNRFIIRRAYWAQISRFSNLLIWTCRTMDFRGIAQSWASVWFCLFGLYSLVTWAVLGAKQGRKVLPVIIGDKKRMRKKTIVIKIWQSDMSSWFKFRCYQLIDAQVLLSFYN